MRQGAVRASAGLPLLVGLVFFVFPNCVPDPLAIEIPLVFMGTSFVGMTGSHLVPQRFLITLGGLLFSGIYIATATLFVGYGGKLGTAACVSSLVIVGLTIITRKRTK